MTWSYVHMGLLPWLSSKGSACTVQETQEMWVQSLSQGRCPGGRHGNPQQYSCLRNPMNRGAWRTTVHGVAKSQTWLKQLSSVCVCVCVCVCFTSVIKGSPIFQPAKICFFIASDPTSSLNLPSLGWILFSAETEILIKVGILSDRDLNNLQLKFWIQFSNDMRSPEVGSQGCVMP